MDYRNADGSKAEMCGNGIRVFARYLADTGLAAIDEGAVLIGTRAGVKTVTRSDLGFEADLGSWRVEPDEVLVRARGLGVPGRGSASTSAIRTSSSPCRARTSSRRSISRRGRSCSPSPRDGANIEFVVPSDPLVREGVGSIRMRVFERGVGETLSCGTGVAAAALAVRHWAGQAAPDRWTVDVPGGTLGVRMLRVRGDLHVLLSGPPRSCTRARSRSPEPTCAGAAVTKARSRPSCGAP